MLSSNKKKVVVKIKNLNVRSNPNVDAPIVETCIPKEYDLLDQKNGFVKIADGKWVSAEYVEILESKAEHETKKKKKESSIEDEEEVVE